MSDSLVEDNEASLLFDRCQIIVGHVSNDCLTGVKRMSDTCQTTERRGLIF